MNQVPAATTAVLADPAELAVPLVVAELTAELEPLVAAAETTMPLEVLWCLGLSRVLFPFTTTDPPPKVYGLLFSDEQGGRISQEHSKAFILIHLTHL